jgi:glycerol-3-phosphate dehydrogenase
MTMNNDQSGPEIVDLLVIGGGINGCSIARDAAGRGLKVVLCEKDDLAAHTSSASTKLIHGGLRYLEQYDFLLVRHSLQERETLLQSAPHIIWPLRFILPHHRGMRPHWLLRLGLFLYDHIGGRKRLPASRKVNLKQHVAGRFLKPEFVRAFEYSDCWVQDARLVIMNARDAARRGATIMTHSACIALTRHQQTWTARIENSRTGASQTLIARTVVNASGPWVAKTLGLLQGQKIKGRPIRLIKGSHIVVKKIFDHAYPYIFQNDDGRILFAIPYEQEYTLLGTTDQNYSGNLDQVNIDKDEIDYICKSISHYSRQAVVPEDVIWSYSGIRPLFGDGAGNLSKLSRDYALELDQNGAPMVTVYGGKITTSRLLAEQVMELLTTPMNIQQPAWTGNSFLPGGDIKHADFDQFLALCQLKYAWLDKANVWDYCRNYGTSIDEILADCQQVRDLGVYFGGGLFECEVIYLVKHEWAYSTDDILWRRTKKGLRLTNNEVDKLQRWLTGYHERH